MLDPQTMRVALGGVALTVLILFYLGVYRPTRSKFSGWWSVSLLCAGSTTSLLLFNGTDLQVIANPASNVLSMAGVTCVWFATRSLRRRRLPLWLLGVAPPAILVPTILGNPAENIWAGNGPLFIYMGVLFSVASVEVWLAWVARRAGREDETGGEAVVALLVIAIASSALSVFYLVRAALYYTSGPTSAVFESAVGTVPTTGFLLVSLVAVTFGVSAVGWDQRAQELRQAAMLDGLTGLMGSSEFTRQAECLLAGARSDGHVVRLVVADLDHFKEVNDVYGHAAGDRALVAFAEAVKDSLMPGEIAGRLGGDEFGLVLLDVNDVAAIAHLAAISEAFETHLDRLDLSVSTVSYGIAGPDDGDTLIDIFERADVALYRAKADGRDRVVKYSAEVARQAGSMMRRRATDREAAAPHADVPRGRG